jgi:ADP-heptose:LPS heptosyltransferase
MWTPLRILIRIRQGYGLGDCVQFSAVLKHLRKYRPHWIIDAQAAPGRHTAFRGLCNRFWHDDETPEGPYDKEVELYLHDCYCNWEDRPNTKVTACLHANFGIPYDPDLGRYEVNVTPAMTHQAGRWLARIGCTKEEGTKYRAVLIHFKGSSNAHKKDLQEWQADDLCRMVIGMGRVPILLDWERRSFLPDGKTIFRADHCDGVEGIAALIGQCEAYIGVDSGPAHVASATDTPTLVCWTLHHPIQFHDPAPNTTHLVPESHRTLAPAHIDGVFAYFDKHYLYRTYHGMNGLISSAGSWLAETLGSAREELPPQTFVLKDTIESVSWAMMKIRAVAQGRPIDVVLAGDHAREVSWPVLQFVRSWSFVRRAVREKLGVQDPDDPVNTQGRHVYHPSGFYEGKQWLIPDGVLEGGRRIEEWMADIPIDWTAIDELRLPAPPTMTQPYVCFHLGSEYQNGLGDGPGLAHNRGPLWTPADWVQLGKEVQQGATVCVIGHDSDRGYWMRHVEPLTRGWVSHVGQLDLGQTVALLQRASGVVSYQSGLGVLANYLGVPCAMWWRPNGLSSREDRFVSFDERMADAWTRPGVPYAPLVYKRESAHGDCPNRPGVA